MDQRDSLNVYLHLVLGLFFLLMGVVVSTVTLQILRTNGRREAETLALALLYRDQATHIYFAEQLLPTIYEMTDNESLQDNIDLPWMSSTYALIQIDQIFVELTGDSKLSAYEWKQAAVNARDPTNEADALEREWIEKMNADPALEGYSGEVEIDGQPYIAVLMRGEVLEAACLPCHGDAADAPLALVEEYGDLGFNRQPGEMVSLGSLRVPLAALNKEARTRVLQLTALFLAGVALLYVFLYVMIQRLLFRPLAIIAHKAQSIAQEPSEVGEQVPAPFGRELKRLTKAFNTMSISLARERDRLQERVETRTAEVQRQKQYFETLVNSNPLAMVVVDQQDRVLSCNPAFEQLFYFVEEEICGQHLIELVVPDEHRQQTHHQAEKTRAGRSWSETSVRRRADGTLINVEVHAVPLEIGTVEARFLVMYQDITQRLAAERVLAKSEKLASLGTLAAGIAHELNSPLQVVTGRVDSVLRRTQAGKITPQETVAELESVKRNAWRIADVVRSLSTYLQPSTGKLELCSLNQAVQDALQLVSGELQTGSLLELRLELADNLRPILCQRSYLVQAVVNLILNARDAMPDGGLLTISTRDNAEAERVELKVCDTGTGIPAECLSRIFDPFFTTKPPGSGTGMGLPVVDAIVRAHNGEIKVSSVTGKGACLELQFPRGNSDDASEGSQNLRLGRYGDFTDD